MVSEAAPAIFSVSIDGRVAPLILHATGALVSGEFPAAAGERVSVYLTGLGKMEAARAPVEVNIGESIVTPAEAGLLPGAAGVYRVEFEAADAVERRSRGSC
jgi:uncharacterized protein (TIGR03437 family)